MPEMVPLKVSLTAKREYIEGDELRPYDQKLVVATEDKYRVDRHGRILSDVEVFHKASQNKTRLKRAKELDFYKMRQSDKMLSQRRKFGRYKKGIQSDVDPALLIKKAKRVEKDEEEPFILPVEVVFDKVELPDPLIEVEEVKLSKTAETELELKVPDLPTEAKEFKSDNVETEDVKDSQISNGTSRRTLTESISSFMEKRPKKSVPLGTGKYSSKYTKKERKAYHQTFVTKKLEKKARKKARQAIRKEEESKRCTFNVMTTESESVCIDDINGQENSHGWKKTKKLAAVSASTAIMAYLELNGGLDGEQRIWLSAVSWLATLIDSDSLVVTMISTANFISSVSAVVDKSMMEREVKNIHRILSTVKMLYNTSDGSAHTINGEETWTAKKGTSSSLRAQGVNLNPTFFDSSLETKEDSFRNAMRSFSTESFSDYLSATERGLGALIKSEMMQSLRDSILVLCSWRIFEKDTSFKVSKMFGKLHKSYTIPEGIELLLHSMAKLTTLAERVADGATLSDIFLRDDPMHEALARARNLMVDSQHLYFGLPHGNKKCATMFCNDATEVVDALVAIKKKLNPFTTDYDRVNTAHVSLAKECNSVVSQICGGKRPTPYCIVIAGPPGIGKSTVINIVLQLWSRIKGREFHPSQVYPRTMTSDYWDGFGLNTPYVHYSEVGNLTSAAAKTRGDDIIRELTSVLDNMEMNLNMSAVDDKGKTKFTGELVVIDTNNPDMNLNVLVNNPAAFRRRMIYVHPVVRPELRKEGSHAIDPSKSLPGAEDNYFDKWTFDVYTKTPVSNVESTTTYLMQASDASATYVKLAEVLGEHMRNHISDQQRNVAKNNTNIFADFPLGYFPGELSGDEKYDSDDDETSDESDSGVGTVYLESESARDVLSNTVSKFRDVELWKIFGRHCCTKGVSVTRAIIALIYACLMYAVLKVEDMDWPTATTLTIFFAYFANTYGMIFYFVFVVVFVLIHINYNKLVMRAVMSPVKASYAAVGKCWSSLAFRANDFIGYVSAQSNKRSLFFATSGIAVTMLIGLIYKLYKSSGEQRDEVETYSTEAAVTLSDVIPPSITKMEQEVGCGKGYKRVSVKGSDQWNVQYMTPSVHKDGNETLALRVHRNTRACRVYNYTDTTQRYLERTHLLGVCGRYAILHAHCFPDTDTVKLEIANTGYGVEPSHYVSTIVSTKLIIEVQTDIYLVPCDNIQFSNILKHFPVEEGTYTNVEALIDGCRVNSRSIRDCVANSRGGDIKYDHGTYYAWSDHKPGKCGLPLIGKRDSGSCILGIHTAGVKGSVECFSVSILQHRLLKAIDEINTMTLMPLASVTESELIVSNSKPHEKSPVKYENLGHMLYYGLHHAPMLNKKSKLVPTCFADGVEEKMFEMFSHVRQVKHGKPTMKPMMRNGEFISPYNIFIRKASVKRAALLPGILHKTVDDVESELWRNLSKRGIPKLSPYTVTVALNGMEEDKILRRVSISKAAGFGTPGIKKDWCYEFVHDGIPTYFPKEEICDQVLRMVQTYLNDGCMHPIFATALKDEPRDVAKCADGRTRMFFMSTLAFLIVQRMFVGPLYTLMIQFCQDFYTAIGIDMHREAHELYTRQVDFSTHILEGDFGAYDISMPNQIGHGSSHIIHSLLYKMGYSPEALQVVRSLLTDTMFPFIEVCGEIFCVPGLQPSGKYGTAEDNSIKNLLIQVYVWNCQPKARDLNYFDYCLPVTYGDDVSMAVKDEVADFFNAVVFARTCKEQLGLKFTTADKGEVTTPFTSVEDMTFLKRNFRYHPVIGRYVAPLDLDSICKTLEWRIPSRFVNYPTQMESICQSVLREIFFHVNDRKTYETFMGYLRSVLTEEFPDCTFQLPAFDTIVESLCPTAEAGQGGRRYPEVSLRVESELCCKSKLMDLYSDSARLALNHAHRTTNTRFARNLSIQLLLEGLRAELKEAEFDLDNSVDPVAGLSMKSAKRSKAYHSSREMRNSINDYFRKVARRDSLQLTIDRLERWTHRFNMERLTTESEAVGVLKDGPISPSLISENENMTDVAGSEPTVEVTNNVSTLDIGQTTMVHLSDFFARPVMLDAFTVTPGDLLTRSIDLWDAITIEPSIRAKLKNYPYLSAKMHVVITCSGMPFNQGAVQVSPQPLANWNSNLTDVVANLSIPARRTCALAYLSQSPGCKVMDIKANEPLELEIPIISPQPVLRLFNDSPLILADTDSYDDMVGLNTLYINSIGTLRSASATSTDISFFVYAYMTDVQLGCPTGTVIQLTTESSHESKTGPIEKTASRLSDIAYSLSNVPEIGPLAAAGGAVLGGVATVASWFGLSKPVMSNEPMRVKNQPFQNGCNTIGYELGKKLTIDPLQELTIDPRVCGTSEDEMSIPYICGRRSLLAVVEWEEGDVPLGTSIFSCPVTPMVCPRAFMNGTTYLYQPTPLMWAASMFEWWRCDITFEFEVVNNNFQRGKLGFYYDPNISQAVVIDSGLNLNKQFIKVIDIQETQKFEFTIKWANRRAWARNLTLDMLNDVGDIGYLGETYAQFANGYFGVVPFTQMQSSDGSPVQLNIYIRSDNVAFNQMTEARWPTVRPTVESESAEMDSFDLNESNATMDHINEYHFGETPHSFRALAKRYMGTFDPGNLAYTGAAGAANLRFRDDAIPPPRPSYSSSSTDNIRPLISYLRYGYIGLRGGTKHRVGLVGDYSIGPLSRVQVTTGYPGATPSAPTFVSAYSYDNTARVQGTVEYIPWTNGGVEFEFPMYTNNLFGLSFSDDPFPASCTLIYPTLSRLYSVYFPLNDYDATNVAPTHSMAAGEDFGLFGFQGCPAFEYST